MAEATYQSWMTKYRPTTFDDVVGQPHVVPVLRGMLKKKQVVPSTVITGSYGCGKTTLARIFSKALLCESPLEGISCNACKSCVSFDLGTNVNYLERDAASQGKVADIRELLKLCVYEPLGSPKRVIVLDEAHKITVEGWNALLKILEDSSHNIFIFCTTELDKIIDTIQSRSRLLPLAPISQEDIQKRLRFVLTQENAQFDEEALKAISEFTEGHLRDALNLAEQANLIGSVTAETISAITKRVDTNKIRAAIAQTRAEHTTLLGSLPDWVNYMSPEDIFVAIQNIFLKHQLALWKMESAANIIPGIGDVSALLDWLSNASPSRTLVQLQNHVIQIISKLNLAPVISVTPRADLGVEPTSAPATTEPSAAPSFSRPEPKPRPEPAIATHRVMPKSSIKTIPIPTPTEPQVVPQAPPQVVPQAPQIVQQAVPWAVTEPAPPTQSVSIPANPLSFLAQFAVSKPIPDVGEVPEE